jgi:cytochrome c-type biogenesis protein CcmF
LYPERRFYKASQQSATIVANRSMLREDLYLVYAGKNQDNDKPIIKAHLNPLVVWIWIGLIIVVLGTVVALVPSVPAAAVAKRAPEAVAEAKEVEPVEVAR